MLKYQLNCKKCKKVIGHIDNPMGYKSSNELLCDECKPQLKIILTEYGKKLLKKYEN